MNNALFRFNWLDWRRIPSAAHVTCRLPRAKVCKNRRPLPKTSFIEAGALSVISCNLSVRFPRAQHLFSAQTILFCEGLLAADLCGIYRDVLVSPSTNWMTRAWGAFCAHFFAIAWGESEDPRSQSGLWCTLRAADTETDALIYKDVRLLFRTPPLPCIATNRMSFVIYCRRITQKSGQWRARSRNANRWYPADDTKKLSLLVSV